METGLGRPGVEGHPQAASRPGLRTLDGRSVWSGAVHRGEVHRRPIAAIDPARVPSMPAPILAPGVRAAAERICRDPLPKVPRRAPARFFLPDTQLLPELPGEAGRAGGREVVSRRSGAPPTPAPDLHDSGRSVLTRRLRVAYVAAKFGSATMTSSPRSSRHRATHSLSVDDSIRIRARARCPSQAANRAASRWSVRTHLAVHFVDVHHYIVSMVGLPPCGFDHVTCRHDRRVGPGCHHVRREASRFIPCIGERGVAPSPVATALEGATPRGVPSTSRGWQRSGGKACPSYQAAGGAYSASARRRRTSWPRAPANDGTVQPRSRP